MKKNSPEPRGLTRKLTRWFVANARDLPWRRTLDPYAVWVSEIMLQQTRVKTVIPYFERWMRQLPTVERLATADSATLHKLWEGLGYYTRARNLQSAAQSLVANGGRFPVDQEAIRQLKGVGRYTAGAIASIAFNRPEPIVDGNVVRVLSRLFALPGDPKEKGNNQHLWTLAESLVVTVRNLPAPPAPAGNPLRFAGNCSLLNQALMELGATVCTPKQPRCEVCPVKGLCLAKARNEVARFPELPVRASATQRRFVAFVLRDQKGWLLNQRPAKAVNGGLWEFPNVEIALDESQPVAAAAKALQWSVNRSTPLLSLAHSVTRYRMRLEVHEVMVRRRPRLPANSIWANAERLDALSLPAAHGKIRQLITKKRPSVRRPPGKIGES